MRWQCGYETPAVDAMRMSSLGIETVDRKRGLELLNGTRLLHPRMRHGVGYFPKSLSSAGGVQRPL